MPGSPMNGNYFTRTLTQTHNTQHSPHSLTHSLAHSLSNSLTHFNGRYAWGHDELQPQTKDGKNWFSQSGMGVSILDAMDTMYIMGLKEEFMKARDWIAANLQFDKVQPLQPLQPHSRSLTTRRLVRYPHSRLQSGLLVAC